MNLGIKLCSPKDCSWKFLGICGDGQKCHNGMIKTSSLYHKTHNNRRKGEYTRRRIGRPPSTEIPCRSYRKANSEVF